MNKATPIKIRRVDGKSDPAIGFIIGSWRDSVVDLPTRNKDGSKRNDPELMARRAEVTPVILGIIDDVCPEIRLAYLDDQQMTDEYVGFIVGEPEIRRLHWVYVKKPYRQIGVGKALLKAVFGEEFRALECSFTSRNTAWIDFARKNKMLHSPII